ncbi:MAG: DUF1156 domain-containing protein [candidate division WOR-3 bacterium]
MEVLPTPAYRKKLIEVALPLEAINAASAREKSIRHGHPSTLHLWWSRKPLATCRAVLFASIVDDPSSWPEQFPTEEAQGAERQRLFGIIERLVKWESSNDEAVLKEARQEILKATDGHPPPVLDPFCGGGSIPLEAQRLGLEAHASDLNPVAVLITKALIEIPPKFAGMPPVNPDARKKSQRTLKGAKEWKGAEGLAEDVRYYGKWMRDEAERRIGHLYPKAKLPDGTEATVIAWLWARTVKCPNPACGAMMPLTSKFALSTRKGKEAWAEPVVDGNREIRFEVRTGRVVMQNGTKGRGKSRCLFCGIDNITDGMLRDQAKQYGMGSQLIAIVAEGNRGRIYVSPPSYSEDNIETPETSWLDQPLPENPRWFSPPGYGLRNFKDLFTPRQLVALTAFSDLVAEARERALADALAAGLHEGEGIAAGGRGARAYADAVATYLAIIVDKNADYWSTICSWHSGRDLIRNTFARQAIPMVWDYAEANPFSNSSGNFLGAVDWVADVLRALSPRADGSAKQYDSTTFIPPDISPIISTDPPYYDNIGYADLSDFFYVWLRRALAQVHPEIFSTLLVPKERELVATPYRFNGSKKEAGRFFEEGLGRTFDLTRRICREDFPITVYYAFKQAEEEAADSGPASTGWEVMLASLVASGYVITGTWPMRTELANRSVSLGTNALASSIVLVCRPRPGDAPLATRREFIAALKRELPPALQQLQKGNIAPVDLAQAAIGPGMAIFSRYSKVLEADGTPMRVRTALQLINQHLDEYLSEQEGEYDPDTRWALSWFEQYGMKEGPFGDAETLSKAKNTSVEGMVQAGILRAGAGKARLLGREEMDPEWDPSTDRRLTVWEATQHLIRALEGQGEEAAAELQSRLGGYAESARDLAYRLYSICERKGWAQEAISYNALVAVWPRLKEISAKRERPLDRKLTDLQKDLEAQ